MPRRGGGGVREAVCDKHKGFDAARQFMYNRLFPEPLAVHFAGFVGIIY